MSELIKPPVVYLTGDNSRFIGSLAVCLIAGGSDVIVGGNDNKYIGEYIHRVFHTYGDLNSNKDPNDHLKLISKPEDAAPADMAVIITTENLDLKRQIIGVLEKTLKRSSVIACNIENIRLTDLQSNAIWPERIIGANWTEPVFTSGFLEIVSNTVTNETLIKNITDIARKWWRKDPYVVKAGYSVRARLMCSILREAFFLVENKYADVEDIDRACRNDAGYYLSFAGNFRYMDLMGLYAYGVVMNDLNSELSKDTQPPAFFNDMMSKKEFGMKAGKGFYEYSKEEITKLEKAFESFSFEIDKIIRKYPFVAQNGMRPGDKN